jgi:hypothetical protein
MRIFRILCVICISVGVLSWLVGLILLLKIGPPYNLSTDPDNPLVKAGRIKYITQEQLDTYNKVRAGLMIATWTGIIGGSFVLWVLKRVKR